MMGASFPVRSFDGPGFGSTLGHGGTGGSVKSETCYKCCKAANQASTLMWENYCRDNAPSKVRRECCK